MGWFWNRNEEQDSGETTGCGDLTEQELSLMNEAEWAQDGEPFHTPVHIHAFPDEGAVYVSDSQGDGQISTVFSYGDTGQANHDLLTSLNGEWYP